MSARDDYPITALFTRDSSSDDDLALIMARDEAVSALDEIDRLRAVEAEWRDWHNTYLAIAAENKALREKVEHYVGWFGTDCRCFGDDGECPIG